MAIGTVTIPGGAGLPPITITTEEKSALQAAVNLEFKKYTNINEITAIGKKGDGTAGYFNLLTDTSGTLTNLKAGTGVQAIIANQDATVSENLIGSAATNLFVADSVGSVIKTAYTDGTATVFGGAGDDKVSVAESGSAILYLEGGSNLVKLAGSDSVSLLGDGTGSDRVIISAGDNTVSASYITTVQIKSSSSTEVLSLKGLSETKLTGDSDTISLKGNNQTLMASGDNNDITVNGIGIDTITVKGAGDTISVSGGATSSIAIKTGGNDTLDLGGSSTIKLSTGNFITLSGKGDAVITEKGGATVIGGDGKLTFTAGKDGADSIVAGDGGGVFTHGKGGQDTFVAGGTTDIIAGAGKDTVGTDLFVFNSTLSAGGAGTYAITAFTTGQDTIDLAGYSNKQFTAALASGVYTAGTGKHGAGGSETITLADGSTLKISGLSTALTANDFKQG